MVVGMSGILDGATWSVDAVALRGALDELRVALEQPLRVTNTSSATHDRAAVLESLQVVLGSLGRASLRSLSTVVREFRPSAPPAGLSDFFERLHRGWEARVEALLGPDKLRLLSRLLASHTPDVLRIFSREDDENSHSDVVAWLLNPRRAPVIAPATLCAMARRFDQGDEWARRIRSAPADCVSVRREMRIGRELANAGDLCRVDVVVSGPGFVLAIENKVWSREHSDQTTTYWEWLKPMRHSLRGGIFMSPSGMLPASRDFHALSYLELVSALLDGPVSTPITSTEEIVLASYLKTLARSIVPVEIDAAIRAVRNMEISAQ